MVSNYVQYAGTGVRRVSGQLLLKIPMTVSTLGYWYWIGNSSPAERAGASPHRGHLFGSVFGAN